MSDDSVVLGGQTANIVRQCEQAIQQAQEKKQTALSAFLEGKGIDKPVQNINQMPDGSIVLEFETEDDDE